MSGIGSYFHWKDANIHVSKNIAKMIIEKGIKNSMLYGIL